MNRAASAPGTPGRRSPGPPPAACTCDSLPGLTRRPAPLATVKAAARLHGTMQDTVAADQDRFAPSSICYGCGPANTKGLRIKSHWQGTPGQDGVFVMEFEPQEQHQAFPGVLNGGLLGTLLDCHSNWCAATALMAQHGWDRPECTVTADFHVKLKRPTPYPGRLTVKAWPVQIDGRTAKVHAEVEAVVKGERKVTATCDGTFVAVGEGHPAYHRWG